MLYSRLRPLHSLRPFSSSRSLRFPQSTGGSRSRKSTPSLPFRASAFVDAFVTTLVGVGIVFVAGTAYLRWYKWNVLNKMEASFGANYDPALELLAHSKRVSASKETEQSEEAKHLRRKEQDLIDQIIRGIETGHYYVLIGSKGSGKASMILDAMSAVNGEGVAMCDVHPDLEVFRLRLGKALNYEFNEDSQTGLFQRRDPKEGGPALDIERALNKLEKVALCYTRRTGRPPVLVFNNIQFFHNDEDGRNMLLQLQQRAEVWAASGILTMVFSSDDFWPLLVLRRSASRMQIISVYDLDSREALQASSEMRLQSYRKPENRDKLKEVVSIVGGRLSYLSRVVKARDMMDAAQNLLRVEKGWLLSQIGLIKDCDDDVMDEQKWSACSWLLLREFVNIRKEQEKERISKGEMEIDDDLPMPAIPYHQCRQIMTRADFLEELDRLNIISIDVDHNVRPDSMLILHAARAVVEEEGFDVLLTSVQERIDEIESLHRTRELIFKDVDNGDNRI